MKQVKLVITSLSSLIILIMVTSVSAYSLDFYYFETDKLVYEVGETINMVSKIKADFSEDGWCYVSFTIITDMGLVYTDEYFITPSPAIRYLSSSYIVYPNETSPGLIGTQARAIFRIEIYDGASQSTGDTIDFNITRGHLEVVPETPLNVEYGTNTTLSFRIVSIHNDNITFPSQIVTLEVSDLNGTSIVQKDTMSDSQGMIDLLWNASTLLPGEFNLTISGNGTESFLPFSQSFQLFVEPAVSSLNVISYPEYIFCESSDGVHTESIDLIVEHVEYDQDPILSSYVCWKTNFSQGDMTDLGDGRYWAIIEFPVKSGTYSINLTATNLLYQTAQCDVEIDVLPRNISIEIEILKDAVAGFHLSAQITVYDAISGSGITSLGLLVNISVGNTIIDVTWEITNSSGQLVYNVSIPDIVWGDGVIIVTTNETIYYIGDRCSFPLNVSFLPTLVIESDLIGVLGYDMEIQLFVCDPIGKAVTSISYDFYNPDSENILSGMSNLNGEIEFIFSIPENAEFGLQKYVLVIHSNSMLKVNSTSQVLEIIIRIPLRFAPTDPSFIVVRGKNATICFIIQSEFTQNLLVDIELYDTNEEFFFFKTITTDVIEIVSMPIDYHVSLGCHKILVIVKSENYQSIGIFEFELIVFASFNFEVMIDALYYGEFLNFSINLYSDDIVPLSVGIYAYFDTCNYSFIIKNTTMNSQHSLNLSKKVYPGEHILIFNVSSPWYINKSKQFIVFVWMKTTLHITLSIFDREINQGETTEFVTNTTIYALNMESNISLGSIISPPPILFNGTTSIKPSTARATSFDSCPRFNSGTNNLSTVFANSLISLSGNGHKILNLRDFKDAEKSFIINSSTVLEVQPYDTIPQSAFFGPEIAQSVNNFEFLWIFDVIRRIR